jgi:hypothetical protein
MKVRIPALIGCLAVVILTYLSSGLVSALSAMAAMAFVWGVFEAAIAERGR